MDTKPLYSKRGGGYTILISANSFNGKGTWPLAKLILRQSDLSFSILNRHIDLKYSDIKLVGVSKSGYVVVQAIDPLKSFGFTSFGLPKIIDILKSSNVPMDQTVSENMGRAKTALNAQLVFIVVFILFAIFITALNIANHK